MKHGRLVFQGCGVSFTFGLTCALIWLATVPASVEAQITGGNRASNYRTGNTNTGGGTYAARNPGSGGHAGNAMIRRGELQNAAIVDTGYIDGTSLVSTDMRNADLWARSIIHADGSFTITEKDEANSQMLTQQTLSANRVKLQERIIMTDGDGLPSEVMIKDAAGNFKYRGVLLYDGAGRFAEEQLYDMNNRLLRRKIQEYGPSGEPKLRVVDYAENLPADIQLVITEENVGGNNAARARKNYDLFRREAKEVSKNSKTGGKKKQGLLGKLFGRRKKS